jgi:hypothetical protein
MSKTTPRMLATVGGNLDVWMCRRTAAETASQERSDSMSVQRFTISSLEEDPPKAG